MKKKYYLTLDTETATVPWADEYAREDAKIKQKIAIAKPLVYDIGWVITDRQGAIVKKVNYLVQETFFVPNVFNTAYYKEKRPIYMELLAKGEISAKTWNDIIDELEKDLEMVDITTAYNACFDFKKAIPFTERYIQALYSPNYQAWEDYQKSRTKSLVNGEKDSRESNPEYLKPYFELRDKKYPLADLWGIACERLININKYKNYCLENKLLTNSKIYFKSSAETSFQYLMKQHDFIEDHTALSDALIESKILTKALKKGKVEPYLQAFPFKELGYTYDYVLNKKQKYKEEFAESLKEYYDTLDKMTTWGKRIERIVAMF